MEGDKDPASHSNAAAACTPAVLSEAEGEPQGQIESH